MSLLSDRLKDARAESGMTQEELAKAAKLKNQSIIGMLESGQRKKSSYVPAIANALGVSALWLSTGTGPKLAGAADAEGGGKTPHEDDYALVPQFHANGSCGDGYMNDHVEIRGSLAFKRDWLARMKIDPAQASVIYARGDSMAPTLNDGEVLLIDGRQTEPVSGKVYVIQIDGDLRVKRLFKRPGGWVIVSDSQDKVRYPDEPLAAITDIRVLGRVAWRGGGL